MCAFKNLEIIFNIKPQEAEACCNEMGMQANGARFVSECVTFVVEKKEADCQQVGDMLSHLIQKCIVTCEQAEEGLVVVVQLED